MHQPSVIYEWTLYKILIYWFHFYFDRFGGMFETITKIKTCTSSRVAVLVIECTIVTPALRGSVQRNFARIMRDIKPCHETLTHPIPKGARRRQRRCLHYIKAPWPIHGCSTRTYCERRIHTPPTSPPPGKGMSCTHGTSLTNEGMGFGGHICKHYVQRI